MGYTWYFAVSLDAMSMATFLANKINLLADFFALFVGKIAKEAAGRPRLPLYPVQFRLALGFWREQRTVEFTIRRLVRTVRPFVDIDGLQTQRKLTNKHRFKNGFDNFTSICKINYCVLQNTRILHFMYASIDWLPDWWINCLIEWMKDWPTDWPIYLLPEWLNKRVINLLTDWLTSQLTDWLID